MKRAGVPAAVIGMFALGVAGLAHEKGGDDSYRRAEVAKVTQANSEFMLLNAGVNMRSTPIMENDGSSGENNIVYKVPEGKQVLVKVPIKSADKPGWVGFYNPDSTAKVADTDNIVWVNLGQLTDQPGAVQEFDYGKRGSVGVHIEDHGFVVDGNPGVPVAEATQGNIGAFNAELPQSN